MRDSVPSVRYSSVCNVLHLWRISLIPTYWVYQLYDIYINMLSWNYVYICIYCIYIYILCVLVVGFQNSNNS